MIVFVSGPPSSGKTTICQKLACLFGSRLYMQHIDNVWLRCYIDANIRGLPYFEAWKEVSKPRKIQLCRWLINVFNTFNDDWTVYIEIHPEFLYVLLRYMHLLFKKNDSCVWGLKNMRFVWFNLQIPLDSTYYSARNLSLKRFLTKYSNLVDGIPTRLDYRTWFKTCDVRNIVPEKYHNFITQYEKFTCRYIFWNY